MRKIMGLMFFLSVGFSSFAGERADINQMLKEINYLKEVTIALKNKYGKSNAKVRFNYDALLGQLSATEIGIAEYLNLKINTLHAVPPKTLNNTLYKVRKN